MVIIREYRPPDKEGVITLWQQIFVSQAEHNNPEISIKIKTKQKDGLFFVAEKEEQIIGTILAGFDGHRGWLYSLAVDPQHRRQGIGTQLVKKAVHEVKKLGCLKVNLQIYSNNHEVFEFYKKNGFLIEDRISMGKIV